MNNTIEELQTLEQVEQRREEVLKEYRLWCEQYPGSYSYPFHQMKALDKRERELIEAGAVVEIVDYYTGETVESGFKSLKEAHARAHVLAREKRSDYGLGSLYFVKSTPQ